VAVFKRPDEVGWFVPERLADLRAASVDLRAPTPAPNRLPGPRPPCRSGFRTVEEKASLRGALYGGRATAEASSGQASAPGDRCRDLAVCLAVGGYSLARRRRIRLRHMRLAICDRHASDFTIPSATAGARRLRPRPASECHRFRGLRPSWARTIPPARRSCWVEPRSSGRHGLRGDGGGTDVTNTGDHVYRFGSKGLSSATSSPSGPVWPDVRGVALGIGRQR